MKIGSKTIVLIVLVFIFLPVFAHAAPSWWPLVPCGTSVNPTPCNQCDLFKLLKNIIDFVLIGLMPPAAAILFIWAGFLVLMGGANPGWITTGKSIFWSTTMGIVIISASWLITNTIIRSVAADNVAPEWYKFECKVTVSAPSPTNGGGNNGGGGLPSGNCTGVQCSDSNVNVCAPNTSANCFESAVNKWDAQIRAAATNNQIGSGIDTVAMVKAIMSQESGGVSKTSFDKTSFGIMQIRPDTGNSYKSGCTSANITSAWLLDTNNAQASICIAINYLRHLTSQCGTTVRNLAAGYNGGGEAKGACQASTSCQSCSICGTEITKRWECPWDGADGVHNACNVNRTGGSFAQTRKYAPSVEYCYNKFGGTGSGGDGTGSDKTSVLSFIKPWAGSDPYPTLDWGDADPQLNPSIKTKLDELKIAFNSLNQSWQQKGHSALQARQVYRPQTYQEHYRSVWEIYAITNNKDNAVGYLCDQTTHLDPAKVKQSYSQATSAQKQSLQKEFQTHSVSGPTPAGCVSDHVSGTAMDITPLSGAQQSEMTTEAQKFGLCHNIPGDEPHFALTKYLPAGTCQSTGSTGSGQITLSSITPNTVTAGTEQGFDASTGVETFTYLDTPFEIKGQNLTGTTLSADNTGTDGKPGIEFKNLQITDTSIKGTMTTHSTAKDGQTWITVKNSDHSIADQITVNITGTQYLTRKFANSSHVKFFGRWSGIMPDSSANQTASEVDLALQTINKNSYNKLNIIAQIYEPSYWKSTAEGKYCGSETQKGFAASGCAGPGEQTIYVEAENSEIGPAILHESAHKLHFYLLGKYTPVPSQPSDFQNKLYQIANPALKSCTYIPIQLVDGRNVWAISSESEYIPHCGFVWAYGAYQVDKNSDNNNYYEDVATITERNLISNFLRLNEGDAATNPQLYNAKYNLLNQYGF